MTRVLLSFFVLAVLAQAIRIDVNDVIAKALNASREANTDVDTAHMLERARERFGDRFEELLSLDSGDFLTALVDAEAEAVASEKEGEMEGPSMLTRATSLFTLHNVLMFLGGTIVMGAMSVFTTAALQLLGDYGVASVALFYGGACALLGRYLWRHGSYVGGGVLASASVGFAPLFAFGVMQMLQFWGNTSTNFQRFRTTINARYVWLELAALAWAAFLFFNWRIHFPFLLFPACFALWFLSMDLLPWLTRRAVSRALRLHVSLVFGTAILLLTRRLAAVQMSVVLEPNEAAYEVDMAFWPCVFSMVLLLPALVGYLLLPLPSLPLLRTRSRAATSTLCMHVLLLSLGTYWQRDMLLWAGTFGVLFACSTVVINNKRTLIDSFVHIALACYLLATSTSEVSVWRLISSCCLLLTATVGVVAQALPNFTLVHARWAPPVVAVVVTTWQVLAAPVTAKVSVWGLLELRLHTVAHWIGVACLVSLCLVTCLHLIGRNKSRRRMRLAAFAIVYAGTLTVLSVVSGSLALRHAGALCLYAPLAVEGALLSRNLSRSRGDLYLVSAVILFNAVAVQALDAAVTPVLLLRLASVALCLRLRQHSHLSLILVSTASIVVSPLLQSTALAVLGGVALFFAVSRLAYETFRNSAVFPFLLATLGMAVVFLGLRLQRYSHLWHVTGHWSLLPVPMREPWLCAQWLQMPLSEHTVLLSLVPLLALALAEGFRADTIINATVSRLSVTPTGGLAVHVSNNVTRGMLREGKCAMYAKFNRQLLNLLERQLHLSTTLWLPLLFPLNAHCEYVDATHLVVTVPTNQTQAQLTRFLHSLCQSAEGTSYANCAGTLVLSHVRLDISNLRELLRDVVSATREPPRLT